MNVKIILEEKSRKGMTESFLSVKNKSKKMIEILKKQKKVIINKEQKFSSDGSYIFFAK